MKHILVSTRNVQRIWAAAHAVEGRLTDQEIMGFGLIFGQPGLGKTKAVQAYMSRTNAEGRCQAFYIHARRIWSETSMLRDLLLICGRSARHYRKDAIFDDLLETLTGRPGVFIIDQVDWIAERRSMVGILHDLHDITGCAILMVGEERVDAILRRYQAMYSRINSSAIIRVTSPTEADVHAVINERCEIAVDPAVSSEISKTLGSALRPVVDEIREMERFARINNTERIGIEDYRRIVASRNKQSFKISQPSSPMPENPRLAAVGGG